MGERAVDMLAGIAPGHRGSRRAVARLGLAVGSRATLVVCRNRTTEPAVTDAHDWLVPVFEAHGALTK